MGQQLHLDLCGYHIHGRTTGIGWGDVYFNTLIGLYCIPHNTEIYHREDGDLWVLDVGEYFFNMVIHLIKC